MAAPFQEIAADVLQALSEDLGAPLVTVRRYSRTTDLVEGTVTTVGTTSVAMRALVVPVSTSFEGLDVRFLDGVRDDSRARLALMANDGVAFAPAPGDLVDFGDGLEWAVLGATPLNFDGATDVLHVVGMRLP